MSEQRVVLLQKGLLGACALFALILLASFYAVVHGAVDRAARQKLAAVDGKAAAPALQRTRATGKAIVARIGN